VTTPGGDAHPSDHGEDRAPGDDGTAARVRAVVVAGHQGDHPAVAAALDDPSGEVRRAALGAAHRLGRLDAGRLLAALSDPDVEVRRRAAELAARRPATAELRRRLVAALDDVDAVAEVAAFSLGEHAEATPEVEAALARVARHHHDALCREAAVAALGAIGAGLPTILAALAEDRATVRRRAVIALAPFDGPEVDAALRRALTDRDWQVRQAAEDLLEP
jgi:HEAT repeat protein